MDAAELAPERPDTFGFRVGSATASGYVVGSIMGAVTANWSDVPLVLRDKPWPALLRTGQIMHKWGLTFAAIGASYSLADYMAEQVRGQKDWMNGVIGGVAAGGALGLRLGRGAPVTIGAMAALAATSFFVDLSGQKIRGHVMVDDGATPPPSIYPYKQA